MRQPESQLTRPWVDWTARQINDPVWRLRYLRAVAPPPPPVSRWKSRKTIGLLTLLALGLMAAPLSLLKLRAADAASPSMPVLPVTPSMRHVELAVAAPNAEVWQVEKTSGFETYSNGLRIENQYAVGTRHFHVTTRTAASARSGAIRPESCTTRRKASRPRSSRARITC